MRAIIAYPLELGSRSSKATNAGWPDSIVSSGAGLNRLMGRVGNLSFAQAGVHHLLLESPENSPLPGVIGHTGIHIDGGKNFNVLVYIAEVEDSTTLSQLRRPGVMRTSHHIERVFGLKVDSADTVLATAIVAVQDPRQTSMDGLLEVDDSRADFAFDALFAPLAAAISVERMAIELATNLLTQKGFRGIQVRRTLAFLRSWMSTPGSDSTRILESTLRLRAGLGLDARLSQVVRGLSHQVKAVDYAFAAFIAVGSLTATALGASFSATQDQGFSGWTTLGVALVLATVSSLLTWFASRRG